MSPTEKGTIPILDLLDISIDHKSRLDMNQLKTNDMYFEAEITYSGITFVPIQPMTASIDGTKGWYAETAILNDIYRTSYDDNADGYKLVDSRYTIEELFGNQLAYLKALLICKMPTITVTISKINMEYAQSVFTTENDLDVKLFGFIDLGGHKNSYQTTDITFNEEDESVTLTFGESDAGVTVDSKFLTAFIMGGTPYYPGVN